MAKQKALFGVWGQLQVSELNRLLKVHSVKLVVKKSKAWGDKVNVTAHPIVAVVAPVVPAPGTGGGDGG